MLRISRVVGSWGRRPSFFTARSMTGNDLMRAAWVARLSPDENVMASRRSPVRLEAFSTRTLATAWKTGWGRWSSATSAEKAAKASGTAMTIAFRRRTIRQ